MGSFLMICVNKKCHLPSSASPLFLLDQLYQVNPPTVAIYPVTSHCNLLDSTTRKGLGYVQMSDHKTKQAQNFSELPYEVRLLHVRGSGQVYYAQLHMNPGDESDEPYQLRFVAEDVIKANHSKTLSAPSGLNASMRPSKAHSSASSILRNTCRP